MNGLFITIDSRTAGFTLIEVMITLSVLLIISQLAVPNITRYFINNTQNSISEKLRTDLIYARNHAVTMNVAVDVIYKDNGWQIIDDFTNDTIRENTVVDDNYNIEINGSTNQKIDNRGIWQSPHTIEVNHKKCNNTLTELVVASIGTISKRSSPCSQRK